MDLRLNADCQQTYTALVYGGVGKIYQMKAEMRDEMRKATQQSKA